MYLGKKEILNKEEYESRRKNCIEFKSDASPAVTVEGVRPLTHTEVDYDFYRMKLEGDIE